MSNSNTFQPNVNTFEKPDDLRGPDRKKIIEPFFEVVAAVTSLFFS